MKLAQKTEIEDNEKVVIINDDYPMNFKKELIKPLLFGVSLIYKAFVLLRLQGYKKGWLKTNLTKTPVISVGNLTVGGTGKTPVVDFLVKELQSRKKIPVILSRGYRRKKSSNQQRLRYCEDNTVDPEFFGDEPFLLAQRNPEVPVYVGSSRVVTAQLAEARDHPDVLVLDDAFQHLAIHRDLNLLLIDAERGLGNRYLLPYGVLREPEDQWVRADAIILTKANLASSDTVLKMLKYELKVTCPIFNFSFEAQYLSRLDGHTLLSIPQLKDKRILLTSGIAQPEGFVRMLEKHGGDIIGNLEFPDHYDYTLEDVQKMQNEQGKLKPDYFITTEKDAVKLKKFPELMEKIWILVIGVDPEDSWKIFFAEFLKHQFGALNTDD